MPSAHPDRATGLTKIMRFFCMIVDILNGGDIPIVRRWHRILRRHLVPGWRRFSFKSMRYGSTLIGLVAGGLGDFGGEVFFFNLNPLAHFEPDKPGDLDAGFCGRLGNGLIGINHEGLVDQGNLS